MSTDHQKKILASRIQSHRQKATRMKEQVRIFMRSQHEFLPEDYMEELSSIEAEGQALLAELDSLKEARQIERFSPTQSGI